MASFKGKKGLIMGVANQKSIATAVAHELHKEGATLGFSYLPDDTGRAAKRVQQAIGNIDAALIEPCDILDEQQIAKFFSDAKKTLGTIDFLVHSIAYANIDDLRKPTLEVSRAGFLEAMNISVYSLNAVANQAAQVMAPGASLVAMTYFGGEKVIPGYNLMGVCKAALDQTVRYLAYDLGSKGIRINAISAGPIRTLASSAVSDFKDMLKVNAAMSPLGENITSEDVGLATAYLLGAGARGITGEILHVDGGYNIMGAPTPQLKELLKGG